MNNYAKVKNMTYYEIIYNSNMLNMQLDIIHIMLSNLTNNSHILGYRFVTVHL